MNKSLLAVAAALILALPLVYNAPRVFAKSDTPGTILALSDSTLTGGADIMTSVHTMSWDGVLRIQLANGDAATGVDVVINQVTHQLNADAAVAIGDVAAFTLVLSSGDTFNVQCDTTTANASIWVHEVQVGQ